MKKRKLFFGYIFIFGCCYGQILKAQEPDNYLFKKVYVSTFKEITDSPRPPVTKISRILTRLFEESLVNQEGAEVLERRQYPQLEKALEQEEGYWELNNQKDNLDSLRATFFRRARRVVYGSLENITSDKDHEKTYELTVRFKEMIKKEIEFTAHLTIKNSEFSSPNRSAFRSKLDSFVSKIAINYQKKIEEKRSFIIMGAIKNNYDKEIDIRIPEVQEIPSRSNIFGHFKIEIPKDLVNKGQSITLEFGAPGLHKEVPILLRNYAISIKDQIELDLVGNIRFEGLVEEEKKRGNVSTDNYKVQIHTDAGKPIHGEPLNGIDGTFPLVVKIQDVIPSEKLYLTFLHLNAIKYDTVPKRQFSLNSILNSKYEEGSFTQTISGITFEKKSYDLNKNILSIKTGGILPVLGSSQHPSFNAQASFKTKINKINPKSFDLYWGLGIEYLSFKQSVTYRVFDQENLIDHHLNDLSLNLLLNASIAPTPYFFAYAELAVGNRLYSDQYLPDFIDDQAWTLTSVFRPRVEASIGAGRFISDDRNLSISLEIGYGTYYTSQPEISFNEYGPAWVSPEAISKRNEVLSARVGLTFHWP